jgi:hypothetical protein
LLLLRLDDEREFDEAEAELLLLDDEREATEAELLLRLDEGREPTDAELLLRLDAERELTDAELLLLRPDDEREPTDAELLLEDERDATDAEADDLVAGLRLTELLLRLLLNEDALLLPEDHLLSSLRVALLPSEEALLDTFGLSDLEAE